MKTISQAVARRRSDGFWDIRGGNGKLLFLYDPERQLVEIKQRGEVELVDLKRIRQDIDNRKGS